MNKTLVLSVLMAFWLMGFKPQFFHMESGNLGDQEHCFSASWGTVLINWTLISDSLCDRSMFYTLSPHVLYCVPVSMLHLLLQLVYVTVCIACILGYFSCPRRYLCVCACFCFNIQQNCFVHSPFWLSSKALLSAGKIHLNLSCLDLLISPPQHISSLSFHLFPHLFSLVIFFKLVLGHLLWVRPV